MIVTRETRRIAVDPWNPDQVILSEAGEILRNGGLVAFPTETVYGLGANALDSNAVAKIYEAKGRPSDNPLILHLSRPEQADSLVYLDDRARSLMREFWPGPLTLVLRAKDIIPLRTRGGLETAALRMPDHSIASALIESAGVPVAAPSANLSGRPSPTEAETVWQDMAGRIDMLLEPLVFKNNAKIGGVTFGIESTVIDISVSTEHPLLLRPGGLPRESLEKFLGEPLCAPDAQSARRSPGTRYRHYAPTIPVYIFSRNNNTNLYCAGHELGLENFGYMGLCEPDIRFKFNFKKIIVFESIENYARGLFTGFRTFEAEGCSGIVVEWPPESGVGLGLRDRIQRAAQI